MKINIRTIVLSEKKILNETKNHTPPFKLNGRSLTRFDCNGIIFHRFMLFITTFNNISVLSWRSVLLMEETGVLRESHRPVICQ
jgi:hypothetical protein